MLFSSLRHTLLLCAPFVIATASPASVVTFDLEINGSSTPQTVYVGDTVTVAVFAHVTDNQWLYNGEDVDLGLALYVMNLSAGPAFLPVAGEPGRWNAVPTLDMGNFDPGWLQGHTVIQLGDGIGVPTTARAKHAVNRQLLATGTFLAVNAAETSFIMSDMLVNVVETRDGNRYAFGSAGSIHAPASSALTVVVPEPSIVLMGLGTVLLMLAPRRRSAKDVASVVA
jgi:hypothetical protein